MYLRQSLVSALLAMTVVLGGCGVTSQLHSTLNFGGVPIQAQAAERFSIGVLTPSMPTGQEADKQALGNALSTVLQTSVPDSTIVAMPEMLSAINRSGLARIYAGMLAEYEDTGILERDGLRQIGEAGNVRYLAKINLGDFDQRNDKRLSIAGIRMFDTWRATIRVHLELWDSETGDLAWQGNEELVFAREGVKEKPVSFSQVAELAAQHLVEKIGETGSATRDDVPEALAAVR